MGRFGHYARKAFSATMTGVHWGISAVPMFGLSYGLLIAKEVPPFFDKHTKEPWNSAVQKFARDILNDPNLNVRKVNQHGLFPSLMVAKYNSIDLHGDIYSHINAILQQKNARDPLEFDQRDKYATMKIFIDNSNIETYKGFLHHEYAHIKNNDIQKFATCAASFSFSNTYCIQCAF